MMIVMALLLIAVATEILGFAFLISRTLSNRLGTVVVDVTVTSIAATALAWAVPFEAWLGLTLRAEWFDPWSISWVVVFWALLGVPAAIVFHREKS